MTHGITPASSDQVYKAVLIVGSDHDIPAEIQDLYKQEGYLIIGDGKEKLASLDLDILKDRIGQGTRIDIWAHGEAENDKHYADDIPTKDFLGNLASYSKHPLHIHLHSCYAGAAAPDVVALSSGSVLATHAEIKSAVTALCIIATLASNRDLSITNPVQDFANKFLLNVKQPTTISIKKEDGSIWQHNIPHQGRVLAKPQEISRHFIRERAKFVASYKKANIGHQLDIAACPEFTPEGLTTWKQDHFLYASSMNDKILIAALKRNPKWFNDCINYQCFPRLDTALMLASGNGHTKVVKALAGIRGINPNLVGYYGMTALMLAVSGGHTETMKILGGISDIDPNLKDQDGNTVLMQAVGNGDLEVVKVLKDFTGIDHNLKDQYGNTALMQAVGNGDLEVIKILKDFTGIDPNLKDQDGNTALMHAVGNGDLEVVKVLKEFTSIDPNLKDQDGNTALKHATVNGHLEVVRVLKEFIGIDPNLKNKEGYTALMLAVCIGIPEVVRTLLLQFPNIDIDIKDKEGYTALDFAGVNRRISAILTSYKNDPVKWLIENNTDPKNIKHLLSKNKGLSEDQQKQRVVILAVQAGKPEIIEWMLANNAYPANIEHALNKDTRLSGAQKQQIIISAARAGKPEIIEQVIYHNPKDIRYLNDEKVVSAITKCLDKHRDEVAPTTGANIMHTLHKAYYSSWTSRVDKKKLDFSYNHAVEQVAVYTSARGAGQHTGHSVKLLLNQAILERDSSFIKKIIEREGRRVTRLYSGDSSFKHRLETYVSAELADIGNSEPGTHKERLEILQRLGGCSQGQIFAEGVNREIAAQLGRKSKNAHATSSKHAHLSQHPSQHVR